MKILFFSSQYFGYRGNKISFEKYVKPVWITSRQIEAGRQTMSQNVRRGGQIQVHIFPGKLVTVKPAETRMGSRKGTPKYWIGVVKLNKILYEMGGMLENIARRTISIAASKIPIRIQFNINEIPVKKQ